jgi:hypothetical protein
MLAQSRARAAVIDVDDIRQLVVSGGVAPWQGEEGRRQQRLGVENACGLARRFLDNGIEVLIADVLSPATAQSYRRLLPDVVVVHLRVLMEEARRRATTRAVHLTEEEFDALHQADQLVRLEADHLLDVTSMTLEEQTAAVARLWEDGQRTGERR